LRQHQCPIRLLRRLRRPCVPSGTTARSWRSSG
jgi:hypothetical protein